MELQIKTTGQFKKDLKLAKKRGLNIQELFDVVGILSHGEELPPKNKNHMLRGDYSGFWECHINADWLLVYSKEEEIKIITLQRTGSHSDIFEKGRKR